MQHIQNDFSLKKYNTFGIDAKAKAFVSIQTVDDIKNILQHNHLPVFILGGGSNLLLTRDLHALVIHNQIKGIEIVKQFKNSVWVAAGGGEIWHDFVLWCIQHNFGGVENMSLIPGTVGAAPIQNIGAYGAELKDVFLKLEAINLNNYQKKIFLHKDCRFAYRESVFKQLYKGQYLISKVYFKLTKNKHRINIAYGDIQKTLHENNVLQPTIKDVSDAVIAIRRTKLPDPAELGNSGSFFKNPEIEAAFFTHLYEQFPSMPHYKLENGLVKIPAGWLIEQCGWKGKQVGNTGSHAKQALVLVNYGNASGEEVKKLASDIIASVKDKFGISLSAEVNIMD